MTDQITRDDFALDLARQFDEAPDDEIWIPPGLSFEPGDRVIIALGAECEHHRLLHSSHLLDRVNGRVGTVRSAANTHYPGHPIEVLFDHKIVLDVTAGPLTFRRRVITGGVFALGELIPLPAAERAGRG